MFNSTLLSPYFTLYASPWRGKKHTLWLDYFRNEATSDFELAALPGLRAKEISPPICFILEKQTRLVINYLGHRRRVDMIISGQYRYYSSGWAWFQCDTAMRISAQRMSSLSLSNKIQIYSFNLRLVVHLPWKHSVIHVTCRLPKGHCNCDRWA